MKDGFGAEMMQVDAASGLLQGVSFVSSPHCDARPAGAGVELLVIHGISLPPGEFGGPWIEQLFTGRLETGAHPYFAGIVSLKVAAHVLIRRDGSCIQYVPFTRRAWHAGESSFRGRSACNDFSIGIELEGTDDTAFEDAQYATLAAVIRALLAAYDTLDASRIVGHSDIAPGRKLDPGTRFDWPRLRSAVGSAATPIVPP